MTTEPTNSEVMRRLDEVARQMADLVQQLRDDRRDAAQTFVRKEVYEPLHEAVKARLSALEAENERRDTAQDSFRKQMTIGVICAAIPSLLALLIILARITGGTA